MHSSIIRYPENADFGHKYDLPKVLGVDYILLIPAGIAESAVVFIL